MIRKGYVDTSFGQVHYRETGRFNHTSQTPILLLHQTASSSIMFEAIMRQLADHFWLVAPDTLGFGQSETPLVAPTISDYANATLQFLAALDIERCFLFGHHTGASIAVQLTSSRPTSVRKLALAGPPLLTNDQIAYLETTLHPFEPTGDYIDTITQRTVAKSQTADAATLYRETLLTLQAGPHLANAYRAVFEQPFAEQLAQITCPTLLLAGRRDSLYASLEATAQLVPHAEVAILGEQDTYICDTAPELLAEQLRYFFAE